MKFNKIESALLKVLSCSMVNNHGLEDFSGLTDAEWQELFELDNSHGLVSLLMSELDKMSRQCCHRWYC